MSDLKNRTLTLEKIFDAPLELVWEAWTSPDHIVQWWAPQGMDLKIIANDFKVGGKWKFRKF